LKTLGYTRGWKRHAASLSDYSFWSILLHVTVFQLKWNFNPWLAKILKLGLFEIMDIQLRPCLVLCFASMKPTRQPGKKRTSFRK
jgi:hypothetical protein